MTTNKQLTEMCRIIFGDIVVKAYFQKENLKYNSNPTVCIIKLRSDIALDWSGEIIIMEFSNGSIVEFQNSEWSYLKKLQ